MTNIDTALVERARELLVTELRCDGAHLLAVMIENLNDGAIVSNPPTSSAIRAIVKAIQSTREKKLEEALEQLLDDMGEDGLCVCQQAKDEAIAALSDGEREEYAWVIERGNSPTSEPKYWSAGQRDAERTSAWTSNHKEAIRFARKVDAEKTARRLFKDIPVRICEHGWTETRWADGEREALPVGGEEERARIVAYLEKCAESLHEPTQRDYDQRDAYLSAARAIERCEHLPAPAVGEESGE